MKNLNERSVRILASLGLILTTMIWGFAFVVMKNSVDLIPPTYLLAIRFSMSAVLLALLFHKNLFAADRQTSLCGAILGIFLCLSYQFQTYGLKYTTASKNAFITTLYVIIVPFFYWIVSKKRPTGRNIAAAFIAVIGLALLSLQGDLTINFGDFLTLVCGLMFAVHMVFIDKFTEHHDPIALTVIQILAAAIINWICAPFLDGSFDFAVLANQSLIVGLLYLAVFSTTVSYLLQNIGQKYLSASTSAILLSLESVFGTLFSVIFLKDVLTGKMLVGCALMFAALILSELPQKKKITILSSRRIAVRGGRE